MMNTRHWCRRNSGPLHSALAALLLLAPGASRGQNYATSFGTGALPYSSGWYNSAFGYNAFYSGGSGDFNTAVGASSLYNNSTGWGNTATGADALYNNGSGNYNGAYGYFALYTNTGSYNIANGAFGLYSNTNGTWNVATGCSALLSNTSGSYNIATGGATLYNNLTGNSNIASGYDALYLNTGGSNNVASGYQAMYNNLTGSNNVAVGNYAGYYLTGNGNIDIGNYGATADNGVIRIGMTGTQNSAYIAGISGVTSTGGVAVYVNSNGQLGTIKSSRRFKNDIKDMGAISAKLMQLRPVTFRYKDSAEQGPHALQYGLIAEDVAKVCPDLVQYDKQGRPYTVYYHLLTPMLLNELQKEHRRTGVLQAAYNAQKSEIAALKTTHNAEIASLRATLQQQSAEFAALKQAQTQQLKALAKLAAYVQPAQSGDTLQKAVFIPHR